MIFCDTLTSTCLHFYQCLPLLNQKKIHEYICFWISEKSTHNQEFEFNNHNQSLESYVQDYHALVVSKPSNIVKYRSPINLKRNTVSISAMSSLSGSSFTCDICNKTLGSSNSLLVHRQTHEPPKFCCPICSKMFGRKYTMKVHIKDCHQLGICLHCLETHPLSQASKHICRSKNHSAYWFTLLILSPFCSNL